MKNKKVSDLLSQISRNPDLTEDEKNDLRYILAHILGTEKAKLILLIDQKLTEEEIKAWEAGHHLLISERLPVHYIINTKNFMGLDFFVDERVLIPRFDTEVLVEEALKEISRRLQGQKNTQPLQILELCTGSGPIPISIIHHIKDASAIQITASDISQPALEVAQINKKKLLSPLQQKSLQFLQSDLFEKIKLPSSQEETYDLILANPPYVTHEEYIGLEEKVKKEPINALVADNQGLFFYDKILSQAKKYLSPKGTIIFEIGHLQGLFLQKLAQKHSFSTCTIIPDYAGNSRLAFIQHN